MRKFFSLTVIRSVLFIYLFALVTACAYIVNIVPIAEIVSGAISLSESSALSSVVSFAQWLMAENNIGYTFLFIFAAPVPFAIIGSLLFAGPLGAFASGMELNGDFPAMVGMGLRYGYGKRLRHVFILFYTSFVVLLALLFVWIIAAIPLAVIKELESRGALQTAVYYATLVVTLLAFYLSLLFLRIYSLSFLPAFYSGTRKAVRSAFSFAGRCFFRTAKFFVAADVTLVLFIVIYTYIDKPAYFFLLNCLLIAAIIFFLVYVLFDVYAAEGYGYAELESIPGDRLINPDDEYIIPDDRLIFPDDEYTLPDDSHISSDDEYIMPDDRLAFPIEINDTRDTMPIGGFETISRNTDS